MSLSVLCTFMSKDNKLKITLFWSFNNEDSNMLSVLFKISNEQTEY